eukprot:10316908-Alexandrium_andersonii.AAC.1
MEGQEETLSRRVLKKARGPREARSYPEMADVLGPEEPSEPPPQEEEAVHGGDVAPNAPLTARQKE